MIELVKGDASVPTPLYTSPISKGVLTHNT